MADDPYASFSSAIEDPYAGIASPVSQPKRYSSGKSFDVGPNGELIPIAPPAPTANVQPSSGLYGAFGRGYGSPQKVLNTYAGAAEEATHLATGTGASVVGGLAGLVTPITNAAGLTNEAPTDVVRGIQEKYTYQPQTAQGQQVQQSIAPALNKVEAGQDWLGQGVSNYTGSPALGAFAKTLPQMALTAMGLKAPETPFLNAVKGATSAERTVADAAKAQAAGYTIPPAQASPGLLHEVAGTLLGKTKLEQLASLKGQPVTQDFAAETLGVPKGTQISRDLTKDIRAEEGKHYAAVKDQVKPFAVSGDFRSALDELAQPFEEAARDVPGRAKGPELSAINDARAIENLRGASAVEEVKLQRADADKAYRAGDYALGKVHKGIAEAIDAELDRALVNSGADPALINNYRNARVRIAKSYAIDSYMNPATGTIDAAKVARAQNRGKIIPADMQPVAQMAQAFPKSVRTPEMLGNMTSGGLGDAALGAATAIGTHTLSGGFAAFAPSILRRAILSDAYQKTLGAASPYRSATTDYLSDAIKASFFAQQPPQ